MVAVRARANCSPRDLNFQSSSLSAQSQRKLKVNQGGGNWLADSDLSEGIAQAQTHHLGFVVVFVDGIEAIACDFLPLLLKKTVPMIVFFYGARQRIPLLTSIAGGDKFRSLGMDNQVHIGFVDIGLDLHQPQHGMKVVVV